MIACAVLAYRYAETENLSGAFWAVVSLALWFGVGWLLPVGFLVLIAPAVRHAGDDAVPCDPAEQLLTAVRVLQPDLARQPGDGPATAQDQIEG